MTEATTASDGGAGKRPGPGGAELRAGLRGTRGLLAAAVVFSGFVNLLGLTGSVFMLQVYDRVLGSRSEETLVALFTLVVLLFAIMGVLDLARNRLLARIAARLQVALQARVFAAMLARGSRAPGDPAATMALRDLEAAQRFVAAPVAVALLDLPWAPLYLLAVFLLHPWLGLTALAGGLLLVAATLLNQRMTRRAVLAGHGATVRAERMADQFLAEADLVRSLGMADDGFRRWRHLRDEALSEGLRAGDRSSGFSSFSRSFRQLLQSALLAVGAWLVLRGEVTGGAMVASSIMMGRALAPVEQAIAGWPLAQRASAGWQRLARLLDAEPPGPPRIALPHPQAKLEVTHLSVVPPGQGQTALRGLSFRMSPGQALGVIGPSGAGKSTLARALTGVWPPAAGQIRLDGATLDQYDPAVLGRIIGYLPQRVTLFDGTIAENIARLAPDPDAAKVVKAAKAAAAHEMILSLPQGYDTPVSQSGGRLSGGQIQRIGLARALYDDPVLLVLDEPNSNLDNDGSQALNAAIRRQKAEGRGVLIMAHRPAAIQECDMLLVLDLGTRRAFGPRDEILRGMVKNAGDIARTVAQSGQGGVA